MFDYRALPGPKGQVELLETIGKGNFGYVYRVRFRLFVCAFGNCKSLWISGPMLANWRNVVRESCGGFLAECGMESRWNGEQVPRFAPDGHSVPMEILLLCLRTFILDFEKNLEWASFLEEASLPAFMLHRTPVSHFFFFRLPGLFCI